MRNNAQEKNSEWFQALIEQMRGISEPKQRIAKIMRALESRNPSEIAFFLHHLSDPEKHLDHLIKRTHLDLIRCRDDLTSLGYELLAAVYEVASQENWTDVKALLRSSPALQQAGENLPEGVAKQLANLTLGERKQLGRTRNRRSIELLVFDSDPTVIRELLSNPTVTERDVIRIASRHQAHVEILNEVCRSDRWIVQYSVKKALIFNPQTPFPFALGLLHHLRDDDLRVLLSGGSSNKDLVRSARETLEKRKERLAS